MFIHRIAIEIHDEKQREIERNIRFRGAREEPDRISIRRRVGHGLIQVGSAIAADGPLQLAARR